MISEIIQTISYLKDAQEEHAEARDRICKLAVRLGMDEKLMNNDVRCARAFLEGWKKGSR